MPNALNDEFVVKPDGLMEFLKRYPLEIDAGQFAPKPGVTATIDGLDTKPSELKPKDQRGVVATLKTASTAHTKGALKFEVIQDAATPVYCDFQLTTAGPNKDIVFPKLYRKQYGLNSVKMFYLPWDADKRHAMDLTNTADYFMTASMHGCRFEVHKKTGNVYHVSHSNVQPNSEGGYDAQKMIPHLRVADVNRGRRKLKFGKDRYFVDAQKLIGSAQHRMIHWGIQPTDVLSAEPETYKANVLGRKTVGDNWEFFYQLWGWVEVRLHERVKKKKWLGLKTEYVVQTNNAHLKVVFLVQKIYPIEETLFKLHKPKG